MMLPHHLPVVLPAAREVALQRAEISVRNRTPRMHSKPIPTITHSAAPNLLAKFAEIRLYFHLGHRSLISHLEHLPLPISQCEYLISFFSFFRAPFRFRRREKSLGGGEGCSHRSVSAVQLETH
jgi:hypothetical protein